MNPHFHEFSLKMTI